MTADRYDEGTNAEPKAEQEAEPDSGVTSKEPCVDAAAAESAAPSDDNDGRLITLLDQQQQLLDKLAGLEQRFDARLQYDLVKETVIDRLHAELQQHREGMQRSLLRPLFLDLIGLHDDLIGLLREDPEASGSEQSALAERMRRNLDSFRLSVEDMLLRHCVTAYTCEGDGFDGKRQRASKLVPTADPMQQGRVAQRLRTGFEYEGRMLRAESVAVYRFSSDAPAPEHVRTPQ